MVLLGGHRSWKYVFRAVRHGGVKQSLWLTYRNGGPDEHVHTVGAGFGVWCGIAKGYYGSVSVDNLGATYSELGGAGAAFVVSAIICFTGLLVAPQDYDFDLMRRRDAFQPKGVDAYGHQTTSSPAQAVLPEAQYDPNVADREEDDEKKVGAARAAVVDSTDAAEDIYVVNDVDDKVVSCFPILSPLDCLTFPGNVTMSCPTFGFCSSNESSCGPCGRQSSHRSACAS